MSKNASAFPFYEQYFKWLINWHNNFTLTDSTWNEGAFSPQKNALIEKQKFNYKSPSDLWYVNYISIKQLKEMEKKVHQMVYVAFLKTNHWKCPSLLFSDNQHVMRRIKRRITPCQECKLAWLLHLVTKQEVREGYVYRSLSTGQLNHTIQLKTSNPCW